VAAVDLAGGLVRQQPGLCAQLLWGARALGHLDRCWAAHVLGCWQDGRTSLLGRADREPVKARAVATVAAG